MKIKLGADPEFFLSDAKGAIVSAHDILPGTKNKPHPVDGGAIQVDGTAVEYNIDASDNVKDFVDNHQKVQANIRRFVDEARPGLVFKFIPLVNYPLDYFNQIPVASRILGCDPDYNAYSGRPNIMVLNEGIPLRTAAGHVHVGWTSGVDVRDRDHFWRCQLMAKTLDNLILFDYNKVVDKKNPERQQYYGAAGAFRPKPYGVEYRALSNKWCETPKLMSWVFNRVTKAVELLTAGKVPVDALKLNYLPFYPDRGSEFWFDTRKEFASDLSAI